MASEDGAKIAHNAVNAEKGLPPAHLNTGVDAAAMNTALKNTATRSLFTNMSKVVGNQNAAKIVHVIGDLQADALTRINQATIVFGVAEAGFMASAALHMMNAANIQDAAAETQEERVLIMATTDAIEKKVRLTAKASSFQ